MRRRGPATSVSGCRSFGLAVGEAGTDEFHDGGVPQGGDVADGAVFGDVAEQSAHDLARAGLGQLGYDQDAFGFADVSNVVGGVVEQFGDQGIVAFVILRGNAIDDGDNLVQELRDHVAKEIGPIAKPRQILVVQELPKTRSGKIMRRLLRDVAENRAVGDTTTLADGGVMDLISQGLNAPTTSEE